MGLFFTSVECKSNFVCGSWQSVVFNEFEAMMLGEASPLKSVAEYESVFWKILQDLRRADSDPWPSGVPQDLDHHLWEFCFAGEPIFVVCNTPAHVLRQSRRSSTLTLTFQPRWVFDAILGTEAAAANAFKTVGERLLPYDMLPKHPSLGKYGNPAVKEYKQYFLDEANAEAPCPFKSLSQHVLETQE